MPGKTFGARKVYLSIISGSLRQTVDKSTKNAVLREYERTDGTTGSKWELSFMDWSGIIRDLRLKDTKFGESLEIEFDDAIITINVMSRYFDDFLMKLPAIKLAQSVTLHPYDFEDDNGKNRRGVSVTQDGEKIKSFYWNEKDGKSCNSLPQPPKDAKEKFKKSDWQLYFLKRTDFLKKSLEKIQAKMTPYVPSVNAPTEKQEEENREIDKMDLTPKGEEEIKMSDIPF